MACGMPTSSQQSTAASESSYLVSGWVFGVLRIDPETVLLILTTTRIPDRIQVGRTGTVTVTGICQSRG